MRVYNISFRCMNCSKRFSFIIPFGMDVNCVWNKAWGNGYCEIKAGCSGIINEEFNKKRIKCSNCGSCNVKKDVVE